MSFLNGVMRLFGADDDYNEKEQVVDYPARRSASPQREANAQEEQGVIPMPASDRSTLYVARPERGTDGRPQFNLKTYADYLRSRQALVLDINALASCDEVEATRVVDFLSGVVEMVDGMVYEVTTNVFIFAPFNVRVDGDPLKQVEVF
jgi:FtsZ-interacting cell division protein YlmF